MIYLIDLEYVESRYTAQWKTAFPKMIANALNKDIIAVEGPKEIPPSTSPGAFLNFGGTNIYKSAQVIEIASRFTNDEIQDGDQFVFADA